MIKRKTPTGGALKRCIMTILLAAALTAAGGCKKSNTPGGRGAAPKNFSIFYTCDTRGHIEPCGCASGMAGGVSRRKSYLQSQKPDHYLLLDAGNVAAGPREWEMLEMQYLLKSYDQMDYHAVNVGYLEASLNVDQLRKLADEHDYIISANLLDSKGKTIFPPYKIVSISDSYKAGVIGIIDDDLPPGEIGAGLTIAPPADVISRALTKVKQEADFIVLLAYADEETMKALAGQFFEIDVIVGGHVSQPSSKPVMENRSAIVYVTDKGKTVGRLDMTSSSGGKFTFDNDIVEMKESLPRDKEIVALIEDYKLNLKDLDIRGMRDDEEHLSVISSARSKDSNKYTGSDACKECHAESHKTFLKTKHANAYATLAAKGHQYNPRCLQCHTTGYATADGYINERVTKHLQNVTCESCHGRGDHHVKLQSKEDVPYKKAYMKTGKCEVCHDADNSPNFDYYKYWEKIKHGKEKK